MAWPKARVLLFVESEEEAKEALHAIFAESVLALSGMSCVFEEFMEEAVKASL